MNPRAGNSFEIYQQRGFWLRCFLGAVVSVGVLMAPPFVLGQVDCVQNHRLSTARISGQVVDPFGVSLPNARISLTNLSGRSFETQTDADGRFRLSAASGEYKFEASLLNFQVARVDVSLGRDAWKTFRPTDLHVILGFVSLYCSWVTTSKREFDYNVRANIKRSKETAQTNATQK
jgi:Carboxypeptidase regulatory-like domain